MSPPQRRRIGRLSAECHLGRGSSDRPTVVVVPGAMDRGSGFRRCARHLPDFDVVALDRRGYAGSIDLEPADRLDTHAEDLAAACAAIGEPVLVLGHSQGALVAASAAATRRIDGLVGLVLWEPPMPWLDWYLGSSLALSMGDDPAEAAEFFMRAMIGDALWERLPQATRDERRREGPALLADLRASRRADAAPRFEAIAVPTVVGRGAASREHHRRSAEEAARSIPGAVLVEVAEAGHGVHLSHPRALAALVIRAWEATLARPGSEPSSQPGSEPGPRR